jgi:oligoendopeptidase F
MKGIEEKMNTASANRDHNIQAMLKRLQDHEDAVSKVNNQQKEQLLALKDKINSQLGKAQEKREAELQKIVDAAKEHEKKVEMVRQKKENMPGVVAMDCNDTDQ